MGVMKALYGMGSPFDPLQFVAIDQESPLTNIASAKTPTLLEYGSVHAGGNDDAGGVALFQGLRHFNTPTKFVRYLSIGHRLSESGPSEQMDAARRDLEWYWYWVLRNPVRELAREYGEPRSNDS